MTIAIVQAWTKYEKADATGSTAPLVLTNVPAAGNLLVAFATTGDGSAWSAMGISDNIGDAGTWVPFTPAYIGLNHADSSQRIFGWYKIVGTPSGGGKTITSAFTGVAQMTLFAGEYGDDAGPVTWTVDGTQVSAFGLDTLPNAGSITTTGTNSVIIGAIEAGGGPLSVGTGFTSRQTSLSWNNYLIQDRAAATATSYAVDTTSPSDQAWGAMGIAFKATPAGTAITSITSTGATEGGAMTFVATLATAVSGTPSTYTYSWGGTATAGTDFTDVLTTPMCSTSVGGTVTVAGSVISAGVGTTQIRIIVPTTIDITAESTETMVLTLAAVASTGGNLINRGVSINDVTVNDVAGTMTFTITISGGAPAGGATVKWATNDVTATAGVNYTGASGTVTFVEGETTKPVVITVLP